jgi:hypothetical protein
MTDVPRDTNSFQEIIIENKELNSQKKQIHVSRSDVCKEFRNAIFHPETLFTGVARNEGTVASMARSN